MQCNMFETSCKYHTPRLKLSRNDDMRVHITPHFKTIDHPQLSPIMKSYLCKPKLGDIYNTNKPFKVNLLNLNFQHPEIKIISRNIQRYKTTSIFNLHIPDRATCHKEDLMQNYTESFNLMKLFNGKSVSQKIGEQSTYSLLSIGNEKNIKTQKAPFMFAKNCDTSLNLQHLTTSSLECEHSSTIEVLSPRSITLENRISSKKNTKKSSYVSNEDKIIYSILKKLFYPNQVKKEEDNKAKICNSIQPKIDQMKKKIRFWKGVSDYSYPKILMKKYKMLQQQKKRNNDNDKDKDTNMKKKHSLLCQRVEKQGRATLYTNSTFKRETLRTDADKTVRVFTRMNIYPYKSCDQK